MKTKNQDLWLVTALTLLATVLRIADLTGRSLWIDESLTLSRLIGSWQDIFANVVVMQGVHTIDLHPPLYFAVLKATGVLLGESEFALKLVGAFASILVVPVTYVLGRRLFSSRVAVFAAAIAFLSPAYQWYGHELRMYTVIPLLAGLSNYFLFRATQTRRLAAGVWALWLGITACALFTHYSVVGLFAAQFLFAAAVIVYKRPKISRRDFAILGGVVGVILVVALAAGVGGDIAFRLRPFFDGTKNTDVVMDPFGDIVQNVFNTTLFGMNSSDPSEGIFTWFVIAVFVLGIFLPKSLATGEVDRTYSRTSRLFLGLVSVFPMVFVLVYYLIDHHPSFRYSILILPAVHVLWARTFSIGVLQFRLLAGHFRRFVRSKPWETVARSASAIIGVVALVSIVVAQVYGMAYTFIHTPSWQDDWRGMAQYIRDNWRPGDVFVITLYTPEEELKRLLYDLPIELIPARVVSDDEQVRQQLTSHYRRIWFANTGGVDLDPNSKMGQLFLSLHRRDRLSFPSQTNILDLMLFEVSPAVMTTLPPTAHKTDQNAAGPEVPDVVGYDISPGNPYHRYSNMQLSLYWRRPAGNLKLGAYSVALRLKTLQGSSGTADQRVWADWFLPARLDRAPLLWGSGSLYREDYVVPLPVGLPNQPYMLELALGAGEKAEVYRTIFQPVDDATLACCIRIPRWPPSADDPRGTPSSQSAPSVWQTSGVILQKTEFPATITPGDILPVILTWRLTAPPTVEWGTTLRLEAMLGGTVVESPLQELNNDPPVTTWPVGEAMRTIQSLQLPFTVKPGLYRLSVARKSAPGAGNNGVVVADGTFLGIIQVNDFPFSPVAQTIPQPVSGKAGEMALLGYALDQPFARAVTLRFQLYWRVESQPARDGVLFLHVVGPDGKMVAQDDNPPEQGKRSTITYRPGEGISQIHRLVIPKDAPAGQYMLYAGVYDRAGQQARWPAQQNGVAARDDLLFLGTLTLPELPRRDFHAFVPLVERGK